MAVDEKSHFRFCCHDRCRQSAVDSPHRSAADARPRARPTAQSAHSHSIVEGGFDEMSSATRFTAGISLMMRLEIVSSRSYGSRAQSAVIASSDVTARITIGLAYDRS